MNNKTSTFPKISIAPMMDYTDRHCRYFLRQFSKHLLLYTEMITTGAILKGDRERLLHYNAAEKPLALQVGGSDPKALAQCAKIAEEYGFDQINLNVGCPSDRVQKGMIGLCLMKHPDLVAECVAEMKAACNIPVTVKTRTGVDEADSVELLCTFMEKLITANVDHVCIHARKGWLKGLSPKENRNVPPLDYNRVYQIRDAFPELSLGINGGVETLGQAKIHLAQVAEVMIGRAAVKNPYILASVDQEIYGDKSPILTREAIFDVMLPYIQREIKSGTPVKRIARHMLGLYHGEPGGKIWRQKLSGSEFEILKLYC